MSSGFAASFNSGELGWAHFGSQGLILLTSGLVPPYPFLLGQCLGFYLAVKSAERSSDEREGRGFSKGKAVETAFVRGNVIYPQALGQLALVIHQASLPLGCTTVPS